MAAGQYSPPAVDGLLEAAIYTTDLDAAKAFYGGRLGLEKILEQDGIFVFFRCGGTVLLIFNPEQTRKQPFAPPARQIPGHGSDGAGHICFSAPGEKLSEWREHLKSQGIAIETEVTWDNGARSIYFRDPAGNSLEFAEPRLWGYRDKTTVQGTGA